MDSLNNGHLLACYVIILHLILSFILHKHYNYLYCQVFDQFNSLVNDPIIILWTAISKHFQLLDEGSKNFGSFLIKLPLTSDQIQFFTAILNYRILSKTLSLIFDILEID